MRKLKRRVLLLQWDVKENAIGNSDSAQQAQKSHEYDGYRINGRIEGIIVSIICIRHGLIG
jgi:hypothetical protein